MKKIRFTPESIAAEKWVPEDAWTDKGPWTFEEYERVERERPLKREIIPHRYPKLSLRNVLPNRWKCAYQDLDVQYLEDAKTKRYRKKTEYLELKHALIYKSYILGCGIGPIRKLIHSKELERYIKEHCASSARLRAMAVRAYESMACTSGYHTWTKMGPKAYLCLASASSALDAMCAVIWALLFNEAPQDNLIPSMGRFPNKLFPDRKKPKPGTVPHSFWPLFKELYESKWHMDLKDARDKVVHRGEWPWLQDQLGVALVSDLEMFKEQKPGFHSKPGTSKPSPKFRRIHLDRIMRGFIVSLEKWEKKAAAYLAKQAVFHSYMKDGIIVEINVEAANALSDSNPERIRTSPNEAYTKMWIKRAQRKTKA